MNLELQGRVASAPVLNFSPGNLSLAPQMEIEAFVLLPSSGKEPVFQLGVVRLAFASAGPSSCVLLSPPPTYLFPSGFNLNITFTNRPFLIALPLVYVGPLVIFLP